MSAPPPETGPGPRGWPGVGPQLAGRLARLDIFGPQDLILHLPLRYEDETRVTMLADVRPGCAAQCEVTVLHCEVQLRPRRQLVARAADASGEVSLRFVHFYPSQQKQLAPGARLRVFGEVRPGFFGAEMIHPRVRPVAEGESLPESLTPVYPTTAGLAQSALRKLIGGAMRHHPPREDLPDEVVRRLDLMALPDALHLLHAPPPSLAAVELEDRHHPAWQRIKLDELLAQQISLRRAYAARRAKNAPPLPAVDTLTRALLTELPFSLTGAQRRAWDEIARDLAAAHPMQRLLQGDVGSGKTCVAALAMLRAAENGRQAVLMAPTEILAEQHYRKLAGWLAPLGLEVAWLSGSRRKREREALIARLAAGELLLAVGTHALIEDPVSLPGLALAVVDEQHRFGVRQRLALREKGRGGAPHMLMMSATPIPRTLAMSYYADLDVSVVDELPPGRTPIVTKLVAEARRDEVIRRVHDACVAGRQAYWVCPLIEESEALQLKTAEESFALLAAALPDLKVGLVHGRLRNDEKSATMAAFVAGEIHVLVATTVIEVGVDVPNASLMVIEHAERFGLAQLHQLRGRVGRGAHASACILIYAQPLSQTGRERLKAIYEHADGFVIAREDLRIRGPGEFIGARQSGVPLLRHADLEADADLVAVARDLAETLLRDAPAVADAITARWFGGRAALLKA
ncbi:MAG TPA: ATP-dependent DNA helicase RecG [Zoogloea sp.]|uniref:ATP-dependent DNA helicase RecG n=1 Tax=Zoogloea sp. TaxID=49181 RepID=UPI002C4C5E2F|nr:ATP-dependent DNA helicase RecG [Zoogloea sp.]HMW51807.1 ATP-dependent DNA helicase RecG [Rhodocyclaceae bacterium]HMZ74868.1 ATP-dependent DNA helicase RecG [Rhodocyclaceae bacterium]HNA68698.1 ATP-dependent DNA helicase RecG [Rhodocyclaceae bacterium]HNC78184.1 ATP-dependent DNA helicase RecG [Rhodocyclaceae bacterium]HNF60387.1 ATP-dependent DNA helicase RecG [Rhodocyclaceae bacterium]